MAAQARNAIADQLERITPQFDALTHRARLGIDSAAEYDELEAMAQAIARDIVAPFRGRRPVHAPLYISADGRKAVW
ncbi:hypothetical protein [Sphingomonas sp. IW22]|uniref:hypothetical protein n=1 Tax=Sphingomonas sp. IW22 TaxID=3242489 RepID=UPI00352291FE